MTDGDLKCLIALGDMTQPDGECCVGFDALRDAMRMDRAEVRRRVRRLARNGLAEYWRGLWNDEGPRGAGYCITHAGIHCLRAEGKGHAGA